jgi:hypothetical protein
MTGLYRRGLIDLRLIKKDGKSMKVYPTDEGRSFLENGGNATSNGSPIIMKGKDSNRIRIFPLRNIFPPSLVRSS